MGGVTDFFFGADEVQPAQQTGSAELLSPEQKALLNSLLGKGQGLTDSGAQIFPGQEVVGPSGIQQDIFGQIQGLLGGDQLGTAFDSALSPSQIPEFDQAGVEDYFRKSMVDPALRAFEKDIMPSIQEKFISQNALDSGGFNRSVTNATGDLTKDLASQLGSLVYGSRETDEARRFTAEESAKGRGLSTASLLASLGLGAGGEQRNIAQQQATGIPMLDQLLKLVNPESVRSPIVQGPSTTRSPGVMDFASGALNILQGYQGLGGSQGIMDMFKTQ